MLKKLNLDNNSFNRLFLFGFTLVVLMVSVLTPPFQSPDEPVHLSRAYSIATGQILLKNGNVNIDKNLVHFKNLNENIRFHYDQKRTLEQEKTLKSFKWSNENMSEGIAGSSVYLPILYIPQGIGLIIGKYMDLSIYNSYQLAKIFSIISCIYIIYLSSKIYPISPVGYLLISMPMSLFQFSSSSPDALSFAVSLLIGSMLARLLINKEKKIEVNYSLIYVLLCLVISLVTIRINMLPIFILLIFIFITIRSKKALIMLAISLLISLTWVAIAYKYVMIDGNGLGNFNQGGMTATDKLIYFYENKSVLINFFLNTFLNREEMIWVYTHFIGVLGWSDTHLSSWQYYFLSLFIVFISLVTLKINQCCKDIIPFITLLLVILFTFFILLLTWTDLSSPIIQGVQGRYFIPIAIILSSISFEQIDGKFKLNFLILIFFMSSSLITFQALIDRYYIG